MKNLINKRVKEKTREKAINNNLFITEKRRRRRKEKGGNFHVLHPPCTHSFDCETVKCKLKIY